MLCQGHWLRDHCTLSQDNEARVPPEQQRAQTDEKKEGRKEECSVVSVVLVQRMERLVTFVAIFGGSGFFTCSKRKRVEG